MHTFLTRPHATHIALLVLAAALLVPQAPAFAETRLVIDMQHERVRKSEGDRRFGLKRLLREQHASFSASSMELSRVLVDAKSIRNNARAWLTVGGVDTSTAQIAGVATDFASRKNNTYSRYRFDAPNTTQPLGQWFVSVSGSLKVRRLIVFVNDCTFEECVTTVDPVDPVDPVDEENAPTLPVVLHNYSRITLPGHFLQNGFGNTPGQASVISQDNTPADNPTTDAGATLGRVLFYDKSLSQNNTTSCATCHSQETGFSDPRRLSRGFDGRLTRRHSMGLSNARFNATGKFFWDERADTLEDQVLMPIQDPLEMGLTLSQLNARVREQAFYAPLFEQAFGSTSVNSVRISRALAQFVRSMVSTNSRYDQGRAQVNSPTARFPNFTQSENDGKDLFFRPRNGAPACAACHVSEAFVNPGATPGGTTTASTNNGIDARSVSDHGVAETTGSVNDTGKFRVPSLRNVEVGAPYMHDGRFASLEDVMDHYSSGIQNHPQLDQRLRGRGGAPVRYGFSNAQKAALVDFMKTLTDTDLLSDEKYSDPF